MSLSGADDTSRKKGKAPSEAHGRRRQRLKVSARPVMRTGDLGTWQQKAAGKCWRSNERQMNAMEKDLSSKKVAFLSASEYERDGSFSMVHIWLCWISCSNYCCLADEPVAVCLCHHLT